MNMQQATDGVARALTTAAVELATPSDKPPSSTTIDLILNILDPVNATRALSIANNLATLGHKHRAAQDRINNSPTQTDALTDRDDLHRRIQAAAAVAAQQWRTAVTIAVLTEDRTPQEQADLDYLIAHPEWLSDENGD